MRLSRRHRHSCLLVESVADPPVFARFYDRYAQRVLVYFARRVLDGETAMDLTAETFAKAYEARAQFRGTVDAEEQGWLFSIARHELSEFWRRGRVGRAAVDRLGVDRDALSDLELERVEDLADVSSVAAELATALSRLPLDQAQAVRFRVVDELAYDEIAVRLGVDPQVVRARVSRGLRTLAEALAGDPLQATRDPIAGPVAT